MKLVFIINNFVNFKRVLAVISPHRYIYKYIYIRYILLFINQASDLFNLIKLYKK